MGGRTFTWKGSWRASTRQVMRGMGLKPDDVRRVVAAKPPARKHPEARKPAQPPKRVAPRPKTPTSRKQDKTGG